MSRIGTRSIFLSALVCCAGITLLAIGAVLRPTAPSLAAVASLSALAEGQPELREVPALDGLDRQARVARMDLRGVLAYPRRAGAGDLPVYVVKHDGAVVAFIAADPRNGCRLELLAPTSGTHAYGGATVAVFHDTCHGSLYDITGRPVGGPAPWNLDRVATIVRDGVVYVDPRGLIPGALRGN